MTRTERLLELIQILRRNKYAISGEELAEELGISLRTVYRDIATLKAQGAPIAGEAGVGFLLKPGFTLPPLMFSIEELEALLLGSRWVDATADRTLAVAAKNAMAKISSVIPRDVKREFETSNLWIGEKSHSVQDDAILQTIRKSIRNGWKVSIDYRDESNTITTRTIWPFVVGFMETCQVVAAWCELRNAYRSFRIDRISKCHCEQTTYPRPRDDLLKEWQKESHNYPSLIEF
jgi:predicted DNA-binding transcriptional regulator YafY